MCNLFSQGVSRYPIAMGILMSTAVLVTYVIAVSKDDEKAFWPYIR